MPLEYKTHQGQQLPFIGSSMLVDEIIPAHFQTREPLSVVRMSDGEMRLIEYCLRMPSNHRVREFTEEWRARFGIEGIECGQLRERLSAAAKGCTYFAPDGGEGFFLKHFAARPPFAEIYFPHRWTRKQRINLLKKANAVIVVHGDPKVAARIRESEFNPDATVHHVPLSDWYGSEQAINACAHYTTKLVLVSGGPASKYIIPRIAQQGKVALDMGSGAPHFWCTEEESVCGVEHCGAAAKVE